MTTETKQDTKNETAADRKLPYVAPKLVHLGSVRELTGTGAGSSQEIPGVQGPRP